MSGEGAFNASLLPDIVVRIGELFANPRSNRELDQPIESLRAVAETQNVNWGEEVRNGQTCIGVNGTFLKDCQEDDTACEDVEVDCTLDPSTQIESGSNLYKPNDCFYESRIVYDDECRDSFSAVEKMSFAMASMEMKLLQRFNRAVIAFLDASHDEIQTTDSGGAWVVGGDGEIIFPFEAFQTPDTLADLTYIAQVNDIFNPVFLSGRNFLNALWNSQYNQLDDDKRSQFAKFNAFPDWYFDIKNLDSVVGDQVTFMFDPANIGLFSTAQFQNTAPENMLDSNNTMVYQMPSQKLSYRNGGSDTPIRFDVTMQRKCTTAGASPAQQRRWGWAIEMKLTTGLHQGNSDCNGIKGIVKVENAGVQNE